MRQIQSLDKLRMHRINFKIRVARKRINPNPNKNCRSKIIVTIPNNEIGMISMLK